MEFAAPQAPEAPAPTWPEGVRALIASYAGLRGAASYSQCSREHRHMLASVLALPEHLLRALLADHVGRPMAALTSFITRASSIHRAGASVPNISSAAADLVQCVVSDHSSSPEAALEALGAAARQRLRDIAGIGSVIVAQLSGDARFMALAKPALFQARGLPDDALPDRARPLFTQQWARFGLPWLASGAVRTLAGGNQDRHAGAAYLTATMLLSLHTTATAGDLAALSRALCDGLAELCAARREEAVPAAVESLLAHDQLVAAVLEAPNAAQQLALALCEACRRGHPRILHALLTHPTVMAALLAAPEAPDSFGRAVLLSCENENDVAPLLMRSELVMAAAAGGAAGVQHLATLLARYSAKGQAADLGLLLSHQPLVEALPAAGPGAAVEVAAALRVACEGDHRCIVAALLTREQVVAAALAAPGHVETVMACLRASCVKAGILQQLLACRPLLDAVLMGPPADEGRSAGRAYEFAQLVRDACACRSGDDSVVMALLADARIMNVFVSAAAAGEKGPASCLAGALLDACRQGREGAVAALLANPTFRAVVLDGASDGPSTLVRALRAAADAGQSATMRRLLADNALQQLVAAAAAAATHHPTEALSAPAVPEPAGAAGAAAAAGGARLGRELLEVLCDTCKDAQHEGIVGALLADAAVAWAVQAQGAAGGRALSKALGEACRWGRAGVVRALLSGDAARRAILDPDVPGRAGDLVWAVVDACEREHAAVVKLLLSDAGFVEVMLGAGVSSGVERLARAAQQARARGKEDVLSALLESSTVAQAISAFDK